jgi:glutathione S-transferase
MLIVHGISLSPYVRKVRAVLAEKHLSYESRPVVAPGPEDFARISPSWRRKGQRQAIDQ